MIPILHSKDFLPNDESIKVVWDVVDVLGVREVTMHVGIVLRKAVDLLVHPGRSISQQYCAGFGGNGFDSEGSSRHSSEGKNTSESVMGN